MKCAKYGRVSLEKKPEAAVSDEPVFVLRGQDVLAPIAVRAYADAVEAALGGQRGRNSAARIREFADEMAGWPSRKLPD